MNKRFFFVTGLPRSRTAWIANLLTTGESICLHGGLLEVGGDVKLLPDWLGRCPYPTVGNSDPSMLAYPNFEYIRETFPQAKWVFVKQDPEKSFERHARAFPELKIDAATIAMLYNRIERLAGAMLVAHRIVIEEQDLDDFTVCDNLSRHCTGRILNYERWKMLSKMKVEAQKAKWFAGLPAPVQDRIAQAIEH